MHRTILIASLTLVSAALAAQEVLIANAGIDAADITDAAIAEVVGGKKVKWGNGTLVTLVLQSNPALHGAFLKRYTSKSAAQVATTWKRIVFTGKGSAPIECGSDDEVIAAVAAHMGAIGYIDASAAAAVGKTPAVVLLSDK